MTITSQLQLYNVVFFSRASQWKFLGDNMGFQVSSRTCKSYLVMAVNNAFLHDLYRFYFRSQLRFYSLQKSFKVFMYFILSAKCISLPSTGENASPCFKTSQKRRRSTNFRVPPHSARSFIDLKKIHSRLAISSKSVSNFRLF